MMKAVSIRRKLALLLALAMLAGLMLSGGALAADETAIAFDGEDVAISGPGAEPDGAKVSITAAGTYRVSGASGAARIVVNADEAQDDVTIILDGCDLTCPDDEVIYFKACRSASLVIADGTENIITSGSEPVEAEAAEETDEEAEDASGSAVRAKCPLTVTGGGSLTVYGYVNNGVGSSMGLTVESGVIAVTAVNDGMKGETVTVSGGAVSIDAQQDGMQADDAIVISGGELNVVTGGGASLEDMKAGEFMPGGFGEDDGFGPSSGDRQEGEDDGFGPSGGSRQEGEASGEAGERPEGEDEGFGPSEGERAEGENEGFGPSEGERAEGENEGFGPSEGERAEGEDEGFGPSSGDTWDRDDDGVGSQKGLKAENAITVTGGALVLDTADDAIHSGGSVVIDGGDLVISSTDDGVHADKTLTVNGGSILITLSYEGLEAPSIHLNAGEIDITANDDGMNANGNSMFPGFGRSSEEPEEETDEEKVDTELVISGGNIIVDSGGDGLDSNGLLLIEGGFTRVSGPSKAMDAALDSGDGYEFHVTGGSLMAAGYSSMMETPEAGDQLYICYTMDNYTNDGDAVVLTDADGNVLCEYSFVHSYNCVVISVPGLQANTTYTLTMGEYSFEIPVGDTGYSNRGGFGGFGGGPGGGRSSGESSGETAEGPSATEEPAA